MAEQASERGRGAQWQHLDLRRINWSWLGTVPFFLFACAFLVLPSASLVIGSFQDNAGNFTLQNIADLGQPSIVNAYLLSVQVSGVTALLGTLVGGLLAWAMVLGRLPRFVRAFLIPFSGVASNFAGVPLAFAFIATLGRVGFVIVLLKNLGFDLYDKGFNLYSFWGLSATYLYFQIPLVVLILTPAFEALRPQWREAAESLGASGGYYWRTVALPILTPALLSTVVLLFGNAFGAYATAYALTGGSLNIVPIMIGAQIQGDILHNPNLGYALAFGMMVIMTLVLALYSWLQRRSARWLQ